MFWLLGCAGGFFVWFRDATSSARPTGPAGISSTPAKGADLGEEGGRVILDFNFAYQPSCSYDPQWSCPLPPRENWLTRPIHAGERFRG